MRYVTFFSFFVLSFSFATISEAAGGLVPCDGTSFSGYSCNFCSAVTLAHNVGKWLVGFLIIVATIVLAVTGVQMAMTAGNSDAKQLLKERMQNIIIGFILILAATAIVDTLMKALVSDGQLRMAWNTPIEQLCLTVNDPQDSVREGAQAQNEIPPDELPEAVAEGTLTQAEAEALLAGAPISISSTGSCSDPTNRTCTSLSGIRPTTLERIKQFQSAVGQPIVITGGTETGHADGTYSHGNGYKVDLRTTAAVNNYITTNYTSIGGNKYKDPYGNIYYRHGPVDHWDVTITR